MSHTAIVINTAVAIIAVVVMIVRFKFNPVVSLVVGSAYLGLAVGLGVAETIDAIMTGFGDIMAEVGLLIAFGVLMGAILQQTGAIQRLVQTLLTMADAEIGPEEAQHRHSIIHLTTIIRDMTGRIAEADDPTFAAIVREAAVLIRSLERRQTDAAGCTVH
jgi:predicted histidine transporter YuiF (NhaC family)